MLEQRRNAARVVPHGKNAKATVQQSGKIEPSEAEAVRPSLLKEGAARSKFECHNCGQLLLLVLAPFRRFSRPRKLLRYERCSGSEQHQEAIPNFSVDAAEN